jgi:hypothetical protein
MDIMPGLTNTQASVLRTLFGSAPDSAVRNLERALSEEAMSGGPMAAVYRLVANEASERRAKQAVFEPLLSLCGLTPSKSADSFPPLALSVLWLALRETCDADAEAAVGFATKKNPSEESLASAAEIYDRLCQVAAAGLREQAPAFARAASVLNAVHGDGAETFAKYLDLTPLARAAMARLPEWVARMTEDRAAAVRVAYKDASNLADDAGPRFIGMLAANLSEPWLIIRILSAVMDHPAEGYMAVSELAAFPLQILDDIDLKLSVFRQFDPNGGRAAGLAASDAIRIAGTQIIEFESSVELSREGPWGKRVSQQKQTMAQLAETQLGQIEKALDAAMPLRMVKFGKGLRGQPNLNDDPNPAALARVEGLLAFFDCSRQFASQSGYGAARTKAGEKIEARLDQYIEDLLEMLHGDQVEALERVRRYLDASAGMMDAVRGEKAGQIVRRRAAAA